MFYYWLFSQGLSARRASANKVCYVSKLDSIFPSPEKMKQDMDQVSFFKIFSINNF